VIAVANEGGSGNFSYAQVDGSIKISGLFSWALTAMENATRIIKERSADFIMVKLRTSDMPFYKSYCV
jgi:hypothetical protein